MKKRSYHFIGIGGISMSGIARLLLEQGHQVSGSDLTDSSLLEQLRNMGALIYIGHKEENIANPDIVVISSAIPSTNVELKKAQRLNITIWQRAQMIAELLKNKIGIAVAGTHGKTTTTSMTSLLLEHNNFKPTVLVGGEIDDIGGNAKLGEGEYLLTEADESDGSFLYLNPFYTVITNIEYEHHKFFKSRDVLFDYFKRFVENLPEDGLLLLCADDLGINELFSNFSCRVPILSFGIENGELQARNIKLLPYSAVFDVYWQDQLLGTVKMKVPGKHNVYNALAAIGLGIALKLEFCDIKKALEKYTGVHRRFEQVGSSNGVIVIDDYAHHPTEIKVTLQAAHECKPKRIVAVFQPHRYSRTKFLYNEFISSFDLADEVIITKIYSASEEPIVGITGKDLALQIQNRFGKEVTYFDGLTNVAKYLATVVRPGDMVLTMGAGDIYKVGYDLLSLLEDSKKVIDCQ